MNEQTNEIIALADLVNKCFKMKDFTYLAFDLYKKVQNLGWDSLTNINDTDDKPNLAVVGSAFYRMACFINNNDEDINSVCAENAFYCLAKAIKGEMQYISAPHLFCLLQYGKSNWGGRLLKEKMDRVAMKMQQPFNNDFPGSFIMAGFYASHFTKILQFYIISLVCDIEDDGYAIAPAVFWDTELEREEIESVIVFVLSKCGNKDTALEIGKYMFDEMYAEIEATLKSF